ncbi:alpha/beta fold hydrolase [Streptomyces sp. NPDC004250]|uniref:alpha/beta fold hydrolase n=1 Tax=Streptomyces sp. NPDC004250 TaxID=3364692 RepID=UPI003688DEDE
MGIEYASHGPNEGEVVLLVMGVGGQLTLWPQGLIDLLTGKGLSALTHDARDVGLSDKMDAAGLPDLPAVIAAASRGETAPVPYHLEDMAEDAVGLLDALGIQKAHIVDGSMGGMVAQLIASDHPEHVLTLTSIMSTTANPELPGASLELTLQMTKTPPDPHQDLEGWLAHSVATSRLTQSPAYPADEEQLRTQFKNDFERCYYPAGFARHYAAILAAPDRRPKLGKITAPTLVIHGADDPLVPLACGRDTADSIPNTELLIVPGMGHDFPPQLFNVIADAVEGVARRART